MKCRNSWCRREASPNRNICQQCHDSTIASKKRQNVLLREQGLCIACRQSSPDTLRCKTCTLKNSLRKSLGCELLAGALRLFDQQQGRCGYTGLPIVIGKDASLDHKTPRSRGGANSLDNLHWVHSGVNRLKGDMDHAEFKAFLAVLRDSLNQLLFE